MKSFCQLFALESDLEARGWKVLPKVDGKNIETWKVLREKIESDGVIDRENIQSEWVNLPLEVENQLFSADSTFLTKLPSVKTFRGLRKLWDCPGNGRDKINLAPLIKHM